MRRIKEGESEKVKASSEKGRREFEGCVGIWGESKKEPTGPVLMYAVDSGR